MTGTESKEEEEGRPGIQPMGLAPTYEKGREPSQEVEHTFENC